MLDKTDSETHGPLDTRKVILDIVPPMYLHDVLLVNCQFVLVNNKTEILTLSKYKQSKHATENLKDEQHIYVSHKSWGWPHVLNNWAVVCCIKRPPIKCGPQSLLQTFKTIRSLKSSKNDYHPLTVSSHSQCHLFIYMIYCVWTCFVKNKTPVYLFFYFHLLNGNTENFY